MVLYFLIPHLLGVFTLPGETGNPEIASFHLIAACYFANRHTKHIKISLVHSWTILHCQNGRLCASDRTYRNKLEMLGMLPTCLMFTKSVTVLTVVSKWELFFMKSGVKTN